MQQQIHAARSITCDEAGEGSAHSRGRGNPAFAKPTDFD
jgi:hypothetical protein